MINLISSQQNIRYLSGFTGSVSLLLQNNRKYYLIVDGRYTQQANEETYMQVKVITAALNLSLFDEAVSIIKKLKCSELGIEEDKVCISDFNKLSKALPGVKFKDISKFLRDKRCIKTKSELENIRKAALIADLVYDCILRIIRPGLTEKEISAHIDFLVKTFKAESPAFETLVSSGKLSAHPHGKPTDKKLILGELIVMDFGARFNGYNSDITRMISLGVPTKIHLKYFNTVLKAQEAAIAKVRSGIPAKIIDQAARDVIKKEKLDKYFSHATGHGVGLAVHEGPRVSMKSDDILKEGMVITIEPGIYLKNIGGFRIEDMVLVTKKGCEILTKSPKKLEVVT